MESWYKNRTGDTMPNNSSTHSQDILSSSIHTSMTAPGVLGVKTVGRLDSTRTCNVWRETNLQLDRTSPKRVPVDASKPGYRAGLGIGYLSGLRQHQDDFDLEEGRPS